MSDSEFVTELFDTGDWEDYHVVPPPPLPCGRVRKYTARLALLASNHSMDLYQWYGAYQVRHGQEGVAGLNFFDALTYTLHRYAERYLCYSTIWDYLDAKRGRGKYRG